MLREISAGIPAQARDRLRDLRDRVQARRRETGGHARPRLVPAELGDLIGHAVNAVDDTMIAARSMSHSLFPELSDEHLAMLSLHLYFGAEGGERRFRHDMYRAARIAAARIGPETAPLVREGVLSDAYASARRRSGESIAMLASQACEDRAGEAARLCAALLGSILAASAAGEDRASTEIRAGCYAPGLLASAWASVDGRAYEPQTLELAMLAVGARRERLAAAAASERPAEELAAAFRSMLLHLI